MSATYEINPSICDVEPAPEWARRPWGRPTVHQATSDANSKLVGVAEFKYYGLRVRGVRIYQNDNGTLSVNMPQKRFGEAIESVFYFYDPVEREQFHRDIVWIFQSIFGRRRKARAGESAPAAVPAVAVGG